jgi:hypothetical protein
MKQKRIDNLITIVLFNAVLILLFSYIYYTMSNELEVLDDRTIKDKIEFIDCLFTSVTIHSGVGYAHLVPTDDNVKIVMILHQLLTIFFHIFSITYFIII